MKNSRLKKREFYCECCENDVKKFFSNENINLYECISCKTIKVMHLKDKNFLNKKDYYDHFRYSFKNKENSLKLTRKRQAKILANEIKKIVDKNVNIIDFGCGKGIFLDEASKSFPNIYGVESSKISFENLKTKFNICLSEIINDKLIIKNKPIQFKNRNLLLALDLIEHFQHEKINKWIDSILANFNNPYKIIIKVPSRKGILFKISYLLAILKISEKPLYQLLQTDSYPPHYYYFSEEGLIKFFEKKNYYPEKILYDLDYEIKGFSKRLSYSPLFSLLINLFIAPVLALVAIFFRRQDSIIIFFKFSKQ